MASVEESIPFVAKCIGGPFDGLDIAVRNGEVPWVMWMEANTASDSVIAQSRIYRYERSSINGGFTWRFEFSGDTLDIGHPTHPTQPDA